MKQNISFCNGRSLGHTLRRYWWLGFINLVVFFFAMPLPALVAFYNHARNLGGQSVILSETPDIPRTMQALYGYADSQGGLVILMLLAMGLAFVAGLTLLHYLHDRRQVNFFHAQPIRREALFVERVLAAVILFAAPLVVNQLLALLVAGLYGCLGLVPWGELLAKLAWILVGYLMVLSITMLAGTLTGTTFAQFEMSALIGCLPMVLWGLGLLLMQQCYVTYMAPGDLLDISQGFTPIMLCPPLHLLMYGAQGVYPPAGWAVFFLILPPVLLAAALLLYRLRALERAQSPLVFGVSRPIVRLSTCAAASVAMALLFSAMTESLFLQILGLILGALLCHMFCQAQFYKDFKAMFRGLPSLGVLTALILAVIIGMNLDVTGYDRYLPDASAVRSISLVQASREDFSPLEYTGGSIREAQFDHLDTEDPQVIEDVLAFLEQVYALADAHVDPTAFSWFQTYSMSLGDASYNNVVINLRFTLRNGRQVFRRLPMIQVPDTVLDDLEAICNLPAYLEKHQAVQIAQLEELAEAKYTPITMDTFLQREQTHTDATPAVIQALRTAIAMDVQEQGVHRNDPVVGRLRFSAPETSDRPDAAYVYILEVRASYANTLRVLEDLGWNESFYPQGLTAGITALRVYRETAGENDASSFTSYLFTDPQVIDAILQAARPREYYRYSVTPSSYDSRYHFIVRICYTDGGYGWVLEPMNETDDGGSPMISTSTGYAEVDYTMVFLSGCVPQAVADALGG